MMYDSGAKGFLNKEELRYFLDEVRESIGQNKSDDDIFQRIFEILDGDGNGEIDLEELLDNIKEILPILSECDKERLKLIEKAFHDFDLDDKGFLNCKELKLQFNLQCDRMGVVRCTSWHFDYIMTLIDDDGNGEINFEEFVTNYRIINERLMKNRLKTNKGGGDFFQEGVHKKFVAESKEKEDLLKNISGHTKKFQKAKARKANISRAQDYKPQGDPEERLTQLVSNQNKNVNDFMPMNNLVNTNNFIEETANLFGNIFEGKESPKQNSKSKRPFALHPQVNGSSESSRDQDTPKDPAKPIAKRNDANPRRAIRGSVFMQLPGFKVGGIPQGFGFGGSPKTPEESPDAIPESSKLGMFEAGDKTSKLGMFGGGDNTLGLNLFGSGDPDRSARESYKIRVSTVAPAPPPEPEKHCSAMKSSVSRKSGRAPSMKPNFMFPESSDSDDDIELFDKASPTAIGSLRNMERKDSVTRDCLVGILGMMKTEKQVESSRGLNRRASFREQKQAKVSMSYVSSGFDRVVELFIKQA